MLQYEFKRIKKVIIANRGEIASRIIKACKANGIFSVSVFSKEDSTSPHVTEADDSILLSGSGSQAYTDQDNLIKIVQDVGADALIPGYGFLSENAPFAERLEKLGIKFIGPSPETIEEFGLKHIARSLALNAGVPCVPGSDLIYTVDAALEEADKIGYPVLLKASAGGGGMGMKVCHSPEEIEDGFNSVFSRSATLFKNTSIFLEKYVEKSRHLEIQVFGNGLGDVAVLGERECSIQRRHQKVIEESPSPFISENLCSRKSLREALAASAAKLTSAVKYKSAGTVEFLVDDSTGNFYFLEMNTRLQVEHGITELTYNVDLVQMMLIQADFELSEEGGISLKMLHEMTDIESDDCLQPKGHSIEVRVYAENPAQDFSPCAGVLQEVQLPEEVTTSEIVVRVDHWIRTGTNVTPFFDPLLAKIMVWAPTRQLATSGMINALSNTKIHGPPNNLKYLEFVLKTELFKSGATLTNSLASLEFQPNLLQFKTAGTFTTVQDTPGRTKFNGGIPKSGPLDDLCSRMANMIVGNDKDAETLEIIMEGPSLIFHSPATIALCGPKFEFRINGDAQPLWSEIKVPAGSFVEIYRTKENGDKAYLAIKGGLPNVATYLGSKSTSPAIKMGGYQGRKFLTGDFIELVQHEAIKGVTVGYKLPSSLIPSYATDEWVIRCLNGPHSSNDILSDKGRQTLYESSYTVNPNSTRGSIALDGPKCHFSRVHGGDGGNHPSNIIEYIYPYRGVSIVADSTVIAGPDGITLSGFISPIVPIEADWWKFGQARVGSKLRFKNVSYEDALELRAQRKEFFELLSSRPKETSVKFDDEISYSEIKEDDVILYSRKQTHVMPEINIRQAGEWAVIVDHNVTKFSLANCGRLYKMKLELAQSEVSSGILRMETSNGSLTIMFDSDITPRSQIIEALVDIDKRLSFDHELIIPSRKIRIPVCLDHSLIKEVIDRYMITQRPYASYLPSNLKYVMKSSCIETVEEFKKRAFGNPQVIVAVSFLCASTIMVHKDPRMSFLSGKYNPPRIWGPAGSITTGSVVQGMRAVDGPGGYMVWGIGLQSAYWDTYAMRKNFDKGLPWFLQPFDQVEMYEADQETVDRLHELNVIGKYSLEFEETTFDLREYYEFSESIKEEVAEVRKKQMKAAEALLHEDNLLKAQWEEETRIAKKAKKVELDTSKSETIKSTVAASVFQIKVAPGDIIKDGEVVVVLEAMKTEIPIILNSEPGAEYRVTKLAIEEKSVVLPDDILVYIELL